MEIFLATEWDKESKQVIMGKVTVAMYVLVFTMTSY